LRTYFQLDAIDSLKRGTTIEKQLVLPLALRPGWCKVSVSTRENQRYVFDHGHNEPTAPRLFEGFLSSTLDD
jgi:hypothetical protein